MSTDTGRTLAMLRKRLRLSQGALARELDVTQPTVSDWESGEKVPGGPALARLILLIRDHEGGLRAAEDELLRAVAGPRKERHDAD